MSMKSYKRAIRPYEKKYLSGKLNVNRMVDIENRLAKKHKVHRRLTFKNNLWQTINAPRGTVGAWFSNRKHGLPNKRPRRRKRRRRR